MGVLKYSQNENIVGLFKAVNTYIKGKYFGLKIVYNI